MKREKRTGAAGGKTNVMRLLEQAGIAYDTSSYEVDESDLSGVRAASKLGVSPELVFKTLVARGDKNGIAVFCIPVAEELDLKKCAAVTHDKRIEMIHVREMQEVTGYIRGGCSPVGMKRKYPVYIDESARLFERIYVSAGVRGVQVIVGPAALAAYIEADFADITK